MKLSQPDNSKKRRLSGLLRDRGADPFSVQEGVFRFGQLKDSSYRADWTEQSFLSGYSGGREIVSRTFNSRNLRYVYLAIFLASALILGRAVWLQVIKGDYYQLLSEGNRLRSETIEAKRGIIYSSDMRPLVRNKANFVLYLIPIDLPKDELARDQMLRQVSSIIDIGSDQSQAAEKDGSLSIASDTPSFLKIKDSLSKVKLGSLESYQPLFVADNIDYDKAMLLAIDLPNFPGVFLSNKIRREYLIPTATSTEVVASSTSLAHVLGYTGKISDQELQDSNGAYSSIDYIGKSGLEYSWQDYLKGHPGSKNIEVDALGRQKKIINEDPAVDGDNLRLSIDVDLQEKSEEIATAYASKAGLKRVSVIILNPNDGSVLALVSLPGYDNNLFAKGISQEDYKKFLTDPDRPLFSRAISGEFPSGSTIKPIFAAGALQDGIINESTSFLSNGGLRISQWFFPDWKPGGHGQTDVRKAIAESVNTFFYYIGGGYNDFHGLGVDGLVKYSRLFGLGEKTGIDLPGERSGFVPTADWKLATKKEKWYIGDTYHFAIGQGDVLVTPLQVANYTAAIANGGTLYKPHVVSQIMDSNNNTIKTVSPEVIRSGFIDPKYLQIVREGMRQTVTAGSARSLGTLPIEAAGKTGTAQWSTKKGNHAWFTGFAPYDKPQIAITVLVEEGVEGSTMAAPIARDIMKWYFGGRASSTFPVAPVIEKPTPGVIVD